MIMTLFGFRSLQTVSKYFSHLYLKSMAHFLSFVPLVSGCFEFLELLSLATAVSEIENHMIYPFFVFDSVENVDRAP